MTTYYKVYAFPMAANDGINQQTFPEQSIEEFRHGAKNKYIGVAFSGGGTRSACCTLGQLKALHDTGMMNKVKYISSVSGGSWTAVPYTFLPSKMLSEFWGHIQEPQIITADSLLQIKPRSFQSCVVNAALLIRYMAAVLTGKGDESFADVLGAIFLRPFGLDNAEQQFSYNAETVAQACELNPNLSPNAFVQTRSNSPYLIVGAVLLNQDGLNKKQKYPVEYTPYYSGIRQHYIDKDVFTSEDNFGGGYINSYGYDCKGPCQVEAQGSKLVLTVKASKRHPLNLHHPKAFSLADIMASSGAAPQQFTNALQLRALGFPEFYHLPVAELTAKAREYSHSDGGHLENLGIVPLLARGVDRLYIFVNTKRSFKPALAASARDTITNTVINKSVKALFVPLDNNQTLGKFADNCLFADGEQRLAELIELFAAKVVKQNHGTEKHTDYPAASALFATQVLTTRANAFYDIMPGHTVTITWIYNQRALEWENALQDRVLAQELQDANAHIDGHNKPDPLNLSHFPHYRTFLENKQMIALTPLQTNLLTSHAYWVAKQALA
jgi:predicted acylesterase/phospholipase RssA